MELNVTIYAKMVLDRIDKTFVIHSCFMNNLCVDCCTSFHEQHCQFCVFPETSVLFVKCCFRYAVFCTLKIQTADTYATQFSVVFHHCEINHF